LNYYNEIDPGASAWLRELIGAKLIPDGHVDTRSICDVQPGDLAGYTQCHFFAGIGGWPHALQLAGWPTDVPVWTGSCPCQPFSVSGRQRGEADERHLWPELRRLVAECRPTTVIGEQVASPLGREWLSGVRSDVEALGYALGAADLCAASVGSPHIRQRLFWVAHATGERRIKVGREDSGNHQTHGGGTGDWTSNGGSSGGLDKSTGDGRQDGPQLHGEHDGQESGGGRVAGRLEHTESDGRIERGTESGRGSTLCGRGAFWSNFDIIPCRDGKSRRVKSKSQRMADGLPALVVALRTAGFSEAEIEIAQDSFPLAHWPMGRVMLLRGYGNAINIGVAVAFVNAYIECREISI